MQRLVRIYKNPIILIILIVFTIGFIIISVPTVFAGIGDDFYSGSKPESEWIHEGGGMIYHEGSSIKYIYLGSERSMRLKDAFSHWVVSTAGISTGNYTKHARQVFTTVYTLGQSCENTWVASVSDENLPTNPRLLLVGKEKLGGDCAKTSFLGVTKTATDRTLPTITIFLKDKSGNDIDKDRYSEWSAYLGNNRYLLLDDGSKLSDKNTAVLKLHPNNFKEGYITVDWPAGKARRLVKINNGNPNPTSITLYEGEFRDSNNIEYTSSEVNINKVGEAVARGTPGTTPGDEEPTTTTEECDIKIEGVSYTIRWMLTPVLCGVQSAVKFVINSFITPILENKALDPNPDSTEKKVWGAFRSLAYSFFVIIFLVIIFAETLNLDPKVYAIGRMIPRFVIAFILVHFSFTLCNLILDVGNVLGKEIYNLGNIYINAGAAGSSTALASIVTAITAVILITGAVAWPVLGLYLLSALISVLVAYLTLVIRQILIVILVIVSPIAVVLFVLPATEKYAKTWLENLIKLSLMYPIIMLIIVGGGLVSEIFVDKPDPGVTGYFVAATAAIAAFLLIPQTFKMAGGLMTIAGGGMMKLSGSLKGAFQKSDWYKGVSEAAKERKQLRDADKRRKWDTQKGIRAWIGRKQAAIATGRTTDQRRGMYGKIISDYQKTLPDDPNTLASELATAPEYKKTAIFQKLAEKGLLDMAAKKSELFGTKDESDEVKMERFQGYFDKNLATNGTVTGSLLKEKKLGFLLNSTNSNLRVAGTAKLSGLEPKDFDGATWNWLQKDTTEIDEDGRPKTTLARDKIKKYLPEAKVRQAYLEATPKIKENFQKMWQNDLWTDDHIAAANSGRETAGIRGIITRETPKTQNIFETIRPSGPTQAPPGSPPQG